MSEITASNRAPCIQEKIRQTLLAAPRLTRTLQSGRAIVHFGPWRHAARAIIRMARPAQEDAVAQRPSLLQLDCTQLVNVVRADGSAMAGTLPPDVLHRLRAITDKLPPGEYGDFHEVPDVRALTRCAEVVGIARLYLQAEPVLLECNLVVSRAENPDLPVKKGSQRQFHFDYAGWHSLNLFVYLTDVSADSGAHEVIIGTHRARKVWDALRVSVPEQEIKRRFPNCLRTITGAAGTMFFEDTSAFHRRKMHTRPRIMLNILYASHRSWLSKGRLLLKYPEYLRSHDIARGAPTQD
jgi:hypothetical protein